MRNEKIRPPEKKAWLLACTAAGGLMMAAAGVAPKEAVSNLSKWAELLGFSEAAGWLASHSADTWGMVIGATIVTVSLVLFFRPRISAWLRRRLGQHGAPVTKDDWEVSFALYWIIEFSAWLRWQNAQRLAHNSKPLGEMNKMHLAESVFRKRAEDGDLTVRGRRRGQLEYEDIPPDLWKSTYLDLQEDKKTLWRATMKARDGLDENAAARVPDYVSFQVSEQNIRQLWPSKDKDLDAMTGRLLKQAKKQIAPEGVIGEQKHPRWFPRWRQQGSGWPPFYRLVPLNKAAELAYKRTHGSLLATAAERPISSGETPNPSQYLAIYIAKTKKTPLFGYNSVSGKLERISPGILDSCTLSEDATELHQFGKDAPIYEGLSIKRTDFKRALLEMEAQWPTENT